MNVGLFFCVFLFQTCWWELQWPESSCVSQSEDVCDDEACVCSLAGGPGTCRATGLRLHHPGSEPEGPGPAGPAEHPPQHHPHHDGRPGCGAG